MPSRNHHFIPKFYLKQWAVLEDQLREWTSYNKTIIPRWRYPDATGWQRDLYSFNQLPPEQAQYFDDVFLQHADDLAAKALKKLLSGDSSPWTSMMRSAWSRFLFSLRFQHPDLIEELRRAVRFAWPNHDQFTREEYLRIRRPDGTETFDEYAASHGPEAIVRFQVRMLQASLDNEKLGTHINGMLWEVLDMSSSGHPLLTAGWPVELSLGGTEPVVSLPISPSRLFVSVNNRDTLEKIQSIPMSNLVKTTNEYVVGRARRHVWSTNDTQATYIKRRMSTNLVPPPFFPNLGKAD